MSFKILPLPYWYQPYCVSFIVDFYGFPSSISVVLRALYCEVMIDSIYGTQYEILTIQRKHQGVLLSEECRRYGFSINKGIRVSVENEGAFRCK